MFLCLAHFCLLGIWRCPEQGSSKTKAVQAPDSDLIDTSATLEEAALVTAHLVWILTVATTDSHSMKAKKLLGEHDRRKVDPAGLQPTYMALRLRNSASHESACPRRIAAKGGVRIVRRLGKPQNDHLTTFVRQNSGASRLKMVSLHKETQLTSLVWVADCHQLPAPGTRSGKSAAKAAENG